MNFPMDQDKELGPLAADTGSRDLHFLVGEPQTRLSLIPPAAGHKILGPGARTAAGSRADDGC